MIKEIQYTGITTTPSDYECPDGQLFTATNLVPEDNQLKPITPPTIIADNLKDYIPLCLFTPANTQEKYYILKSPEKNLVYLTDKDKNPKTIPTFNTLGDVSQVTSVGNIIVIASSNGIHYARWKENSITYIGSDFPKLNIFATTVPVVQESYYTETVKINITKEFKREFWKQWDLNPDHYHLSGDPSSEDVAQRRHEIAEPLFAAVNTMQNKLQKDGHIAYPCYLRAALRLYDGKYVAHTPPMLLLPNSHGAPIAMIIRRKGSTLPYCAQIKMPCADIRLSLANPIPEEWRDIVVGVDFFISTQMQSFSNSDTSIIAAKSLTDSAWPWTQPFADSAKIKFNINTQPTPSGPRFDQDDTLDKFDWMYIQFQRDDYKTFTDLVAEPTNFFLISQMTTEEYNNLIIDHYNQNTERTNYITLPIEKTRFNNLQQQTTLPDTGQMHDNILPQTIFAFNKRIHVAIKAKIIKQPNFLETFFVAEETAEPEPSAFTVSAAMLEIKTAEQKIYVPLQPYQGDTWDNYNQLRYFYTHTPNATRILLKTDYGIKNIKEIPLKTHSTLSGSYAFNAFQPLPFIDSDMSEQEFDNNYLPFIDSDVSEQEFVDNYYKIQQTVNYGNTIITSHVDNPFILPEENANTLGTGKIIGLSSATKALSQGQFGQFPMYAFTDDGIWALETTQQGTYHRPHPVTRDVCNNPSSITQIDDAVLFTSDRGIMMISGRNSICISENIEQETFPLGELPKADKLLEMALINNYTSIPFNNFINNCKLIYDYPQQRIIAFNSECNYAYVYSLKTKQWGTMLTKLNGTFHTYPWAIATTSKGEIVNLRNNQENLTSNSTPAVVNTLLITRPLKLDMPDILKTIDTVIQRGLFHKGHIKTILYGSRNLYTWHLVKTSQDHYLRGFRGTPYKYFRIALIGNMTPNESIYGCTIQFTPKHTNQPR